MGLADEWIPPGGGTISMACVEKGQVLLATGGAQLHLLESSEADGGSWRVVSSATMEHEVACVAICSAHEGPGGGRGPASAMGGGSSAMQTDSDDAAASTPPIPAIAACGLWTDLSIRLLSLPSLAQLSSEPLGGAVIPRSLAFAPMAGRLHIGMDDHSWSPKIPIHGGASEVHPSYDDFNWYLDLA